MIVTLPGVTSTTRLAKQHILSIFRRLLEYFQSKNFKHFETENIKSPSGRKQELTFYLGCQTEQVTLLLSDSYLAKVFLQFQIQKSPNHMNHTHI